MVIEELIQETPPDELFNYTSHDGLIGIAKNKELWASKAIFMNDVTEFRLALDLARDAINARSFSIDVREELLQEIDEIEHVNVFVASFSQKKR